LLLLLLPLALPWEYRRRGGLAEDDDGWKGLGSSLLLLSPALGIATRSNNKPKVETKLYFYFDFLFSRMLKLKI
jgi:hypothetical protein